MVLSSFNILHMISIIAFLTWSEILNWKFDHLQDKEDMLSTKDLLVIQQKMKTAQVVIDDYLNVTAKRPFMEFPKKCASSYFVRM